MGLYFNVCDGSLSFDFGKAANEEEGRESPAVSRLFGRKITIPRRKGGKEREREGDSKLTFKIRVKRLTHPLCSALSVLPKRKPRTMAGKEAKWDKIENLSKALQKEDRSLDSRQNIFENHLRPLLKSIWPSENSQRVRLKGFVTKVHVGASIGRK